MVQETQRLRAIDRLRESLGLGPKSVKKSYPNVPRMGGNTEAQRVGAAQQEASDTEDKASSDRWNVINPFSSTDIEDATESGIKSDKAREALDTAKKQAGYKKGGKIDFSQIIRNRKTGVLSMKKSTGGMVRGTGCAERGKGKGTVY